MEKLLSYIGVAMWVLGMCLADSELFIAPCVLIIAGLAFIVWGAYEDGYFRGKRK